MKRILLQALMAVAFCTPAAAFSFGGTCSNWMVSSVQGDPVHTERVCKLMSGRDTVSFYDPRSRSCYICDRRDWTSAVNKPPVRQRPTQGPVTNGSKAAGSQGHPCWQKLAGKLTAQAQWTWNSGGNSAQVGGVICEPIWNGYITFDGSRFTSFDCGRNYTGQCRRSSYFNATAVQIEQLGGGVVRYRYRADDGRTGWVTRGR